MKIRCVSTQKCVNKALDKLTPCTSHSSNLTTNLLYLLLREGCLQMWIQKYLFRELMLHVTEAVPTLAAAAASVTVVLGLFWDERRAADSAVTLVSSFVVTFAAEKLKEITECNGGRITSNKLGGVKIKRNKSNIRRAGAGEASSSVIIVIVVVDMADRIITHGRKY